MNAAKKQTEATGATIYTLTAKCVWGAHWQADCVRVLEMRESQTLYELHRAIQKAVKFDDDHLHEFYASRTVRSRPRFSLTEPDRMRSPHLSSAVHPGELAQSLGYPIKPVPDAILAAEKWAMELANMDDPPLNKIFPLPDRFKLYYWFDFGDDWKFEIRKHRKVHPPEPGKKYPRVIEQVGPDPQQYPNAD